jgi:hypothetical protein
MYVCPSSATLASVLYSFRLAPHQSIYRFFVTEQVVDEDGSSWHRLIGVVSILDILRQLTENF